MVSSVRPNRRYFIRARICHGAPLPQPKFALRRSAKRVVGTARCAVPVAERSVRRRNECSTAVALTRVFLPLERGRGHRSGNCLKRLAPRRPGNCDPSFDDLAPFCQCSLQDRVLHPLVYRLNCRSEGHAGTVWYAYGTDYGTDRTSRIPNVYRPWYDGTDPAGCCAAGAETPNSKHQTPGESSAREPWLSKRIKPN